VQQVHAITLLLDKLDKITLLQFEDELSNLLQKDSKPWLKVQELTIKSITNVDHNVLLHSTTQYQHYKDLLDKVDDQVVRDEIDSICSNLDAIINSVRAINPRSRIIFHPIMVRGMDYYTGPVYEAVVEGFSSSILGGGRYDELIGQFAGKKIPAVGCSIGFERILSLLQEQELKKASPQSSRVLPRVLLIRDGVDTIHLHQQAEKLREGLRSEGIGVEVYLDDDDVGKQFKYAEAAGITWAIKRFEAATSTITVRYIPTRQDHTLSLQEFETRLHTESPG